MSGDDRFDRDLRSTLHELASEPAPDRLIERVAAIPGGMATGHVPPFRRAGLFRAATTLAAAAVLVVVVGAILVSRPGRGPSTGGQPGGSVSPSAAAASSAPAPSGSPGGLVPIVGSPAPASAGPTASATASGSVPAGFQPVSVTFASPDLGWVLGTSSCSTSPCVSILRTSDSGRTWVAINVPGATVVPAGEPASGATTGVSGLRFADALDGWAYGPDLWATHDGGVTWHSVTIPGAPPAVVVALEAGNGLVHAVLYDTQDGQARIASSPVGRDGWTLSPVTVPVGAGPVPYPQLVLSGTGGWFMEVDRVVVGGARLVNGAWTAWTPACADVLGPALLAASSSTELVAACDVGEYSTPQGEHLYVSHDGGSAFAESATPLPMQGAVAVTSANPSVILVSGGAPDRQTSVIVGSFDGGKTWQTVLDVGGPVFTYLGFTTPTQGVAITQTGTGTGNGPNRGTLLMTRDGGHTWSAVVFGP